MTTQSTLITLEDSKIQCRIELCMSDDDVLLLQYINSAHRWIESYLDRNVYLDSVPEDDTNGIVADDTIRQACRCLVTIYYDKRDGANLDYIRELIENYRNIGV